MEFLSRMPLKAWIWLFIMGIGLTVGLVAASKIDLMKQMLSSVQDGSATETPPRARVATSSDPVLDRAQEIVEGMSGDLDAEAVLVVGELLARIERTVGSGDQSAAIALVGTLDNYRTYAPADCQVRAQVDGAGAIKAIPLSGGRYRLPIECWSSDGTVFHPDIASLMPIVSKDTLDSIVPRGVIGTKAAKSLRIEWRIAVL